MNWKPTSKSLRSPRRHYTSREASSATTFFPVQHPHMVERSSSLPHVCVSHRLRSLLSPALGTMKPSPAVSLPSIATIGWESPHQAATILTSIDREHSSVLLRAFKLCPCLRSDCSYLRLISTLLKFKLSFVDALIHRHLRVRIERRRQVHTSPPTPTERRTCCSTIYTTRSNSIG
jgi:hypothetical protein